MPPKPKTKKKCEHDWEQMLCDSCGHEELYCLKCGAQECSNEPLTKSNPRKR